MVNIAALVLFVAVELGFSYFNFPTPRAMLLVAATAILFRCGELTLSRHSLTAARAQTAAVFSISAGLIVPFALAAATRQFHTHYFGLLILPVLEAALYFSLSTTLVVATFASGSAALWVAYAAHFKPPFQLGELIETATLILLLFTVGTLVWTRKLISVHLRAEEHSLVAVGTIREGLVALETQDFDVIVTDQKLPDGEGLEILEALSRGESATALVVLTAFGTVELAVETMRKGAFDFLTKPFAADNLKAVIARAAQYTLLRRENVLLRNAVDSLEGDSEIHGRSTSISRVKGLIRRVGPTDATVLITGETGTGKELVARAVHKMSMRAGKPLMSVNCAAFPETLLESELFGHEKGSFTGADRVRYGLFETAHQGTLFLDEAGEMSPAAQAKLLRVLAEGKITRVGSTISRDVDVRVLVATHRNLLNEVEKGRFRQDLYYRLVIVPIEVPPLRERLEDVPALASYLLHLIAGDLKMAPRKLHPNAIQQLQSYSYPGNIRELRNLLERACILTSGPEILSIDLPLKLKTFSSPLFADEFNLRDALAAWERDAIVQTLAKTQGGKAEAARRLGLSKSDMTYKLAKYGISNADGEVQS